MVYKAKIVFKLPYVIQLKGDNIEDLNRRADDLAYFYSENVGYDISIYKEEE